MKPTLVGVVAFLGLLVVASVMEGQGPSKKGATPSLSSEGQVGTTGSGVGETVTAENAALTEVTGGSTGAVNVPEESLNVKDAHEPIVEHLQAGMILDYATFLVAAITAIFAVFLAGLGFVEWRRFEAVKRDVDAQRRRLKDERKALEARVDSFKVDLQSQERRVKVNQRFLEAVLAHHSALLVGIVRGFGAALEPDEGRRLGGLIAEAESALDLFYPEKGTVLKALMRLEQIGADGSVASLVQLRDDESADAELRIRAQQVLTLVKARVRAQRAPRDSVAVPQEGV